MNENQTIRQSFWPRHFSWLTILLAILACITFIAISGLRNQYIYPMGIGGGIMESSRMTVTAPSATGMPISDQGVVNVSGKGAVGSGVYYPYPYPSPDAPITDTREFLKIYYSANMRTREVAGLTRRVVTTVRGYAGRIDQESTSPEYGYVSFAIPQAKFDAFRGELESLVNSRFLSINVSSQNLLSQKLSIEEQQKQADTTLADYKTARQKIVALYTSAAQSLQSRIEADTKELQALGAQTPTSQTQISIQSLSTDLKLLKEELQKENTSYATQLSNTDANIKYAQDWQKAVQTQDKTFLDNVATVTGSVSIQDITLWQVAQVYLPGYWIPTIFLALSFLSLLWDRRRFGVKEIA